MTIRERFFEKYPHHRQHLDDNGILGEGILTKSYLEFCKLKAEAANIIVKKSEVEIDQAEAYIHHLEETGEHDLDFAISMYDLANYSDLLYAYKNKVCRHYGLDIQPPRRLVMVLAGSPDGKDNTPHLTRGLEYLQSRLEGQEMPVSVVMGIQGIGQNPFPVLDEGLYMILMKKGSFTLIRASRVIEHVSDLVQRTSAGEFAEAMYKELFNRWKYGEMVDGKAPDSWEPKKEEAKKALEASGLGHLWASFGEEH